MYHKFSFLLLLSSTFFFSTTCRGDYKPLDFQNFSTEQKLEDFHTLASGIEEYYAMLDYKAQRFGFNWKELKKEYLDKALETETREDFASVLQQLVAKLNDAHTDSYVLRDYLMNGGVISFSTLGFVTERGNIDGKVVAVVSKVFDSFSTPIKEGDILLSVNGRTTDEIYNEDILPLHNLGQTESNLTALYGLLTLRPNYFFANLPTGIAKVKVTRGEEELEFKLSWNKASEKDVFPKNSETERVKISKVLTDGTVLFEKIVTSNNDIDAYIPTLTLPDRYKFQTSFVPAVFTKNLFSVEPGKDYPSPSGSMTIDDLPFVIQTTSKGLIAVLRVKDFFTADVWWKCGDWVEVTTGFQAKTCFSRTAEEFASAFSQLSSLGIQTLVLDLRSNGGGFLALGYEFIRAFARESIELNLASLRLNEEWIGVFKSMANNIENIPVRDAYKTSYDLLKSEADQGLMNSSPVSIVGLGMNFGVETPWSGKTYILVDELCASMCDIFTTLMQDHKLATVIGKQTMGAGGNVIEGPLTPHTKIAVTLTASRMYRLDGSTIENNGAIPDVVTQETRGDQFWTTVKEVIDASK